MGVVSVIVESALNAWVRLIAVRDSQEGQTLVEYALILALMSLALIAGLTGLRNDLANAFAAIGGALTAAAS
jgi:Flp pilus assembly pilin Flp